MNTRWNSYLFESSRRDLHNALLCTALESTGEKWGKKDRSLISKFSLKIAEFFAVFFQNFAKFARILLYFAEFSPNLIKFFRDFSTMQLFSEIPNYPAPILPPAPYPPPYPEPPQFRRILEPVNVPFFS